MPAWLGGSCATELSFPFCCPAGRARALRGNGQSRGFEPPDKENKSCRSLQDRRAGEHRQDCWSRAAKKQMQKVQKTLLQKQNAGKAKAAAAARWEGCEGVTWGTGAGTGSGSWSWDRLGAAHPAPQLCPATSPRSAHKHRVQTRPGWSSPVPLPSPLQVFSLRSSLATQTCPGHPWSVALGQPLATLRLGTVTLGWTPTNPSPTGASPKLAENNKVLSVARRFAVVRVVPKPLQSVQTD